VPRLVVLGGGSGPSLIVQGFRESDWAVTAIVTTTDTGSSSGIIRDQFGLPAPGDIRTVLAAAANPRPGLEPLVDLFEFRFRPAWDSSLRNMALGNLILTAFAETLGGFDRAVEAVARLFDCWAAVLPLPSSPATLCARLADGSTVRGEFNIRAPGKAPIAEVPGSGGRAGSGSRHPGHPHGGPDRLRSGRPLLQRAPGSFARTDSRGDPGDSGKYDVHLQHDDAARANG